MDPSRGVKLEAGEESHDQGRVCDASRSLDVAAKPPVCTQHVPTHTTCKIDVIKIFVKVHQFDLIQSNTYQAQ